MYHKVLISLLLLLAPFGLAVAQVFEEAAPQIVVGHYDYARDGALVPIRPAPRPTRCRWVRWSRRERCC